MKKLMSTQVLLSMLGLLTLALIAGYGLWQKNNPHAESGAGMTYGQVVPSGAGSPTLGFPYSPVNHFSLDWMNSLMQTHASLDDLCPLGSANGFSYTLTSIKGTLH